MVRENRVRHKPFSRVVGLLMTMATKVPKKKFRKVAKNAQIRVHPRTPQNCLLITLSDWNSLAKVSKPIQSKYMS